MTFSVATPTTSPVLTLSSTDTQFASYLATFDGVFRATTYSGADMGEKISAALTAAYAAGGGTVDARGFVCPTNCHIGTADLQVGDFTHPVTLILPYGTIARDTISGTGKSAQIIYASKATVIGQGPGVTVISGPSDVVAMQQANHSGSGVSNVTLEGFSIQDTGTVNSGVAALMVGGKNPDGSRGDDVLSSVFSNLTVGGADIGTLLDGQHGCICYNKFHNVNSSGATIGVQTLNNSGFGFGVNSNVWDYGVFGGAIGLWDAGGMKFTWNNLDFESSASGHTSILYAHPDGNNRGTGYAVGDTVRPAGGDSTAVLTVSSVSSGAVTGLSVTTPGSTYANALSASTTTLTGSGTGLKVDIRVFAYILELAGGGTVINNPYEESYGYDFFCGTGAYVTGSYFSVNGGSYLATKCSGPTTSYSGPLSNFFWGPGATPPSIGLGGAGSYIAFGSSLMYDTAVSSTVQSSASSFDLWADGPTQTGTTSSIYPGSYGHSTWKVGVSTPLAGTKDTGRITISKLPAPSVPVVTVGAGTPGSAAYTYAFACASDGNSGAALPSAFSSPVTGPDVLGAWLTMTPAAGGSGYSVSDVVTITGGDGTAQGTVTSVDGGGAVTGLSVTTPGSGYATTPRNGYGGYPPFPTTGGSGSGLTVTGTASYMNIAFTPIDGCTSFAILKGDSSTQLDGSTTGVGWNNANAAWLDFGGSNTKSYTAPARDSTGDVSIAGKLSLGGTSATWTSASGVPSGSCTTGSLYTNTAGGTGTTLYVCESTAWVAK